MSTLARAIQLATAVAARSRAGHVPSHLLPPLRVMLALEQEEECMAAVLHPPYEAGQLSLATLVAAGFPPAVIRAIDAMTPRPGEGRLDAAARASRDCIARAVRLVECTEELDFTGLPGLTAQDLALIEEYRLMREVLMAGVLHEQSHAQRAAALPAWPAPEPTGEAQARVTGPLPAARR